ncbi:hypothetical protein, partial [Mesorhizobium sp. WSM3626]|uniref:hypothetical protein n=1 Tax=Mesorhizobium sp. WSM3626 TaxID=1040987 RepID=UPI0018DD1DBA
MSWKNTAGSLFTIGGMRPELVGFEVEMTKNGNKYAPPVFCAGDTQLGQCWIRSYFDYHTTPHQEETSTINNVGFRTSADPNTKYCFRVRARRKSDQVVSAVWSGTSCVTTPSQPIASPPPPEKPVKHTGRSNACVAYGDRMSAIASEARGL